MSKRRLMVVAFVVMLLRLRHEDVDALALDGVVEAALHADQNQGRRAHAATAGGAGTAAASAATRPATNAASSATQPSSAEPRVCCHGSPRK